MAIALRRALISSRSLSLLLRTSSLHSPHHSHFLSSPDLFNSSASHTAPNFPAINFIGDSRREGDDDANTVEIVDIGPSVKATAVSLMEAAVDSLSRELSKLRTGRASAGMLDHIIVETGGVKMPLSRLAVVSVIDSKTLSVTPYDPNYDTPCSVEYSPDRLIVLLQALKELERAIVSSPLGLNPKVDGQRLIAPIPP
ncbi:hypothetical protein RHGRI_022750 [Rhododendron griersonianum]|nr:hypothetical protein RHGRI_022750 [Rhododendron griersonianum]